MYLNRLETSANSVDSDETYCDKPPHQDLHFLLFGSRFFTDIPICNNERVQIHRRNSPLQKLRDERVTITCTTLWPNSGNILVIFCFICFQKIGFDISFKLFQQFHKL